MSKTGQEATSSEGSFLAKPKLGVTQPMEREGKSSADFVIPGQSGNVDEGQGSHTSTRRLVRTTQNPDVERSQVRRQENSQNSVPWKQGDQEESSNSTGIRRLVRAATPRTDFQNMKYTNHQHMTKIFHFLLKKLGVTTGY